jgi:hypothetical protein
MQTLLRRGLTTLSPLHYCRGSETLRVFGEIADTGATFENRAAYSERTLRLVDCSPAHHRADDLKILDFFFVHREKIVRQHYEVGQLAG